MTPTRERLASLLRWRRQPAREPDDPEKLEYVRRAAPPHRRSERRPTDTGEER